MRDIDLYTKSYLNSDFEVYQVQYRRKKVIECIKKYSPSSVLEIGCGMNPLFHDDRLGGIKFTVIEPSIEFYKNALMLNTDGNIQYVNAPYIAIRDEITMDGRIKKIKLRN